MWRTIALAVLALGAAAFGPLPEALANLSDDRDRTACDSESQELVETALPVLASGAAMDGVWPGFWPEDRPFILTVPQRAVLLVSPVPPGADFVSIDDPRLPGSLRVRLYVYCGTLPGLAASRGRFVQLSYEVKGVQATAVPLQETRAGTWELLFHESFHAHQRGRFAATFDGPESVDVAPEEMLEFDQLGQHEREMLIGALQAETVEGMRCWSASFLAARSRRWRSVSPPVVALQRHFERIEGTAHLVGSMAALVLMGPDSDRLNDRLAADLQRSIPRARFRFMADSVSWKLRAEAYANGAAMGAILDALHVQWRPSVEDGEDLDVLLADAVERGGSPEDPGQAEECAQP